MPSYYHVHHGYGQGRRHDDDDHRSKKSDADDDDNADGDHEKKSRITLDWRDYVALFIALLETVALPMLLLIGVILVTLVALRLV
jgi:ABC-type uncharacterized transport system involved in gliding motility auxiliary subunit